MTFHSLLYDCEGNVVECKCGKPAGIAAMGKDAYQAWCQECCPFNKEEAKFVFRKPKNAPKVSDEWVKNLFGDKF